VDSRSGVGPAAALLAGFAADLIAGDPRRFHPVAGFGSTALALERRLYAPTRRRGLAMTGVLVLGAALFAELLARAGGLVGGRVPRKWPGRKVALAAVLWAALGGRSLRAEALELGTLVEQRQLPDARRALQALCGRDAAELDAHGLCRAATESLAENTSDAVVGALVWAALAGPAGVAAYRAANTLDAMIGHRSQRYADFGWAAAKLDDLMNWPAARLCAALACACAPLVGGSPLEALAVARRDGPAHPSPNAGPVEAAFAGALGLTLGGAIAYGGRAEQRPELGHGRTPDVHDVHRATRLSFAVGVAAAVLCALLASVRITMATSVSKRTTRSPRLRPLATRPTP
jgi:adenosylcobinamide-phosphate synthase